MKKLSRTHRVGYFSRYVFQLSIASLSIAQSLTAFAQTQWVPTETRAHPTGNAAFRAKLADTEAVKIVVGLRLRNGDKLEPLIKALGTAGESQSGHWLTPEQILADYMPTESQAEAVATYLTQSGFTNVQVASNRLLITADGTAASIRNAFNTELAHYVRDGKDGIVNLSDAAVPSELGDAILSVLGLQTLDVPHVASSLTSHDPVAFPTVYDATSLAAASNTAVGIITEGSMTQPIADLHTFEAENSLPTINPTVVNVGGTSSDTSNQTEWDLDTQTIQAMSGGALKEMLLYTAPALTDADLAATYNKAESDNIATVVNVSLQECETSAYTDGSMATDDNIFRLAVAQGQTFSAASGDDGSNECSGSAGVSYPASSPYVLAVGGTDLYTNGSAYSSETAWSGSGGGPSSYEVQPVWQNSIVSGSKRGVPDLAFDADPSSGAAIVVSGTIEVWGGTSLASPLFAGSWARLQSSHGNTLGFPAPWIYTSPTSMFHDVTSGSNGAYSAAVGWDYVTGWGSLDVGAANTAISSDVTDTSIMTEGAGPPAALGFEDSTHVFGSMNPAKTSNGYTYTNFSTEQLPHGGGYTTTFAVSGFSANPGQGWLKWAFGQGYVFGGSTATSFAYSAGTATWQWSSQPNFTGTGTTACTIAHN